jgi:hypothetical protein
MEGRYLYKEIFANISLDSRAARSGLTAGRARRRAVQVPADRLAEHAERRAAAMVLCDQAIARGASEHDWPPIEGELRASWRSLRDAV